MAKKERFRRRERTVEDIRRKASEGSRDFDQLFTGDVKMFRPADGENIIRIMPPTWGLSPYTDDELDEMSDEELAKLQEEDDRYDIGWDLPVFVHYGIGPDDASYLCRDKMLGERCPICEAKAAATDPDEADAFSPTKRGLAWVIDRNSEKDGPQLWSMPWSKIRNEIYSRSIDKKHGTPIMVDDPEEGFDIIFNKSGKDTRTQYTSVEVDRDATPLNDDEKKMDRWLDYTMQHRLPDVLNFYDAEYIEKVLYGRKSSRRSESEDEEEETGRKPGRRSSIRERTRRDRTRGEEEERDYKDEDEDAGEDDAPFDTEEDEAPARTRRRRGASSEEPEDEEEETSSRGSRRRRTRDAEEEAPDTDPDEGEEDEDASPTDQARSRLGRMRSRRSRG